MKIGDKVRFLSEVGGGTIKGFQGKDVVLVEDADGFEIPVISKEVVVIDTDDYNMERLQSANEPEPQKGKADVQEDSEPEIEEQVVELAGGNKLNVSLAFVPEDVKTINSTSFDAYIVNDSNYFLYYIYSSGANNAWKVRSQGVISPNMKSWMETFMQSDLNDLEHVCVQLLAYKKDRSFELHPAMDIRLRLDTVKFYKMHCFGESDFFDKPSLIYDLVKDDMPIKQYVVKSDDLQQEMMLKKHLDEQQPARIEKKKEKKDDRIVVDLHISELLDSTSGMNNTEMLNYQLKKFRQVMEENKNNHKQKIVFIHGKGEGVLRKAVLDELKRKYNNSCTWQDASFQEYGFGATEVTIR